MTTRQVTFGEAIGCAFRGFFKWNGRATRSEYWWFVLFTVIVGFAIGLFGIVLALVLVGAGYTSSSGTDAAAVVVGVLAVGLVLVIYAVVGFPMLSLTIRRMHDVGRSAWWVTSLPILYVVTLVLQVSVLARSNTSYDPTGNYVTDSSSVGLSLLLIGLSLVYAGLGIAVFVFTLMSSTTRATVWDGGYRPALVGSAGHAPVPYQAPGYQGPAVYPAPYQPPPAYRLSSRLTSGQAPAAVSHAYRLPSGAIVVPVPADPLAGTPASSVEVVPGDPQYDHWSAYLSARGQ